MKKKVSKSVSKPSKKKKKGTKASQISSSSNIDTTMSSEIDYLQILEKLAIATYDAVNIDEAMQACLDEVCAFTGWPVGHVYVASEDKVGEMNPAKLWHLDRPRKFKSFKTITENTSFSSGIGLPGRVLSSGKPAWVMDVTRDSNFQRAKHLDKIGLKSAFGFPILISGKVVAVLEFFTTEAVEPDEQLLQVMSFVGTQLGRVMEYVQTRDALRESQESFELAMKGTNDGMWDWPDISQEKVWLSPRYYELLGYKDGEFEATISTFEKFVHADDLKKLRNCLQQHFKKRTPYDIQYRLQTKSGNYCWVRGRGQAVWDEKGKPVRIAGSIRDITESKEAEAELQKTHDEMELRIEERTAELSFQLELEHLVGKIPNRFSTGIDVDSAIKESLEDLGKFTLAERSYLWVFSHDHSALTMTHEWCASKIEPQISLFQEVQCSEFTALKEMFNQLESGKPFYVDDIYSLPSKQHKMTEFFKELDITSIASFPIKEEGQLVAYFGLDHPQRLNDLANPDISLLKLFGESFQTARQRLKTEIELLEAKERAERASIITQTSLENMGQGIFMVDGERKLLSYNEQLLQYVGISKEDAEICETMQEFAQLGQSTFIDEGQESADHFANSGGEGSWLRTTTEGKVFEVRQSPIKGAGFVRTYTDITERKKEEERLQFRLELEQVVSTTPTRFSSDIDLNTAIIETLRDLGELISADRVSLWHCNMDTDLRSVTHEWCADGVSPQIEELQGIARDQSGPQSFVSRLESGKTIYVADMSLLPASEKPTKDYFIAHSILSIAAFPLIENRKFVGFISINAPKRLNSMDDPDISLLKIFGENLQGARRRRQAELDLLDAKENAELKRKQLLQLIDASPIPMQIAQYEKSSGSLFGIDFTKMTSLNFNKQFTDKFGWLDSDISSTDELLNKFYPDSDYCEEVTSFWEKVMLEAHESKRGDVGTGEFRIVCKNKEVKFAEISQVIIGQSQVFSLVDITERKHNEKKLQFQLKLEHLTSIIPVLFSNDAKADSAVITSLKDLGELTGSDRVSLWQFSRGGESMTMTHEWCLDGIEPHIQMSQDVARSVIEPSGLFTYIESGDPFHISNIDSLPDKQKKTKEYFREMDIASIAALPILEEGKLVAYFTLNTPRELNALDSPDISMLKVFGESLHNAMQRQKAESALVLAKTEAERASAITETTLQNMGQGILMIDRDDNVMTYNDIMLNYFNIDKATADACSSMNEVVAIGKRSLSAAGEDQARHYSEVGGAGNWERTTFDGRILEVRQNPLASGGYVRTYTDISTRKEAEQALHFRLELEQIVTAIPNRFTSDSNTDDAIIESLKEMGIVTGAERISFFSFTEDGLLVSISHEWCNENIEPTKDFFQNVPYESLIPQRESMQMLNDGKIIYIQDVHQTDPELKETAEFFEKYGINSVVVIPVMEQDRIIGLLSLDTPHKLNQIKIPDLSIFQVYGKSLYGAMQRRKAEIALVTAQDEAVRASSIVQATLENMGQGIIMVDRHQNILVYNDQLLEFIGVEKDSAKSSHSLKQLFELGSKSLVIDEDMASENYAQEGGHARWERFTKDGKTLEVQQTPMIDGGFVRTISNITRRKAAEQTLHFRFELEQLVSTISQRLSIHGDIDSAIENSLKDLSELTESDRISLWQLKNDGKKMSMTHEWCSVGVESHRAIAQNIAPDMVLPSEVYQLLKSGQSFYIKDINKLTSEQREISGFFSHVGITSIGMFPFIENERFIGFFSLNEPKRLNAMENPDISMLKVFSESLHNAMQRRKAETALVSAKKIADNALGELESVSSIILRWKTDMTVISINQYGLGFFGYSVDEIEGKHLYDNLLQGSEIAKEDVERISNFAVDEPDKIGPSLNQNSHKDGRLSWIFWSNKPILDEQGVLKEILSIGQDMTEQKNLEASLEEAKLVAESATEAKSEFLANMSHEIRTPMNAITGLSHLLSKTKLNNQQGDYLNKIETSATLLLQIINDILDFSKIEAGKLEMESIKFSLEEVLENLSHMVATNAADKGIELIFRINSDVPESAIGDPLRLGQILVNLVNNAIKFTQDGEIIISVSNTGTQSPKVKLVFSIEDTGIGIESSEVKKLFEPFIQADGSITRRYGGTGLGLTICKHLVEMMDGKIWAESTLGQGSTFSFTASFDALSRQQLGKPDSRAIPSALLQARVLVVDDSKNALEVCALALRDLSFKVSTATSAQEGIDLLKGADANDPFTLVFMDWRMPEMDGLHAGRIIKNEIELAHKPDVILITAFGQEDIIRQAETELDGCLLKPISQSTLYDAVINVVASNLPESETGKAPLKHSEYKIYEDLHVLVVDDNEINQQVLIGLLADIQCKVSVANDGLRAIELINREDIDLVFMDIQMPVMDGFEATNKIRSMSQHTKLPIIAMTAHAMQGDYEKCLMAGMNDYVSKPIDVKRFFETLDKWIAKIALTSKHGKPTAIVQVPSINDENEPGELNSDLDLVGINTEQGLKRVGNNEQLYRKLLIDFTIDQGDSRNIIAQALLDDDDKTITFVAHAVKGVAGNLGMEDLELAAGKIETLLEAGKEVSDEQITAFYDNMDLVFKAIEKMEDETQAATEEIENKSEENNVTNDMTSLLSDINKLSEMIDKNSFGAASYLDQILAQMSSDSALLPLLQSTKDNLRRFDYGEAKVALEKVIKEARKFQ